MMANSVNVNVKELRWERYINNNRLSRLQKVILKVLSTTYSRGLYKRRLCKITAHLYGNSIIRTERRGWHYRYVHEVIEPKFSVSYSRSIKNLLDKGLITSEYRHILITDAGLLKIKNGKVEVHYESWKQFLDEVREGKL